MTLATKQFPTMGRQTCCNSLAKPADELEQHVRRCRPRFARMVLIGKAAFKYDTFNRASVAMRW